MAQRCDHTVPECQSRCNCPFRGLECLGDTRFLSVTETFQQAQGQRCVKILVQMDMAVEIKMKHRCILPGNTDARQQCPEHAGDDVFTPDGQRSRNHVRLAGCEKVEGGAREVTGRARDQVTGKRSLDTMTADMLNESAGSRIIGTNFAHGCAVELEVAQAVFRVGARQSKGVGLLLEHEFVDETLYTRVICR